VYTRDSEGSQERVPQAFISLFVPPGRSKPTQPLVHIAERHAWCEDLAQLLTETARQQQWSLGITEDDVLRRLHAGLQEPASAVDTAEAGWVLHRVAELLDWPQPGWLVPLRQLREG
jgi:hypothetical protein